ncbi:MAG: hydantoinase B/oxoprolinase family protein, partial [Deltaproteobacteria bacterium]
MKRLSLVRNLVSRPPCQAPPQGNHSGHPYKGGMMDRAFDPILVEVIKNELAAITEEMAIAVWKTGRSAMVKTGDFATAMCDGQGRLIGQGYAAPFQLAFFIEMMPYVLNKYGGTFKPGDVLVVNDPYAGIT